jgi:hypothetical protein
MSSEKLYSEIFEEFDKCTTKADRINCLRKYDHPRFRTFLQAAFNPHITFDVPIPNYRPAVEPAGMNYAYLDQEVSKLYRFAKGHPARPEGLTPEKQKALLTVILESLHKDEAALMIKMLQKDLQVKFLTVNLINETFPGIL